MATTDSIGAPSRADTLSPAAVALVDAAVPERVTVTAGSDAIQFVVRQAACGGRRPGYDEASGRLLPGHEEIDLPGAFMQCRRPVGHDGSHWDALRRPWAAA